MDPEAPFGLSPFPKYIHKDENKYIRSNKQAKLDMAQAIYFMKIMVVKKAKTYSWLSV